MSSQRTASGLKSYDQARWSEWVPRLTHVHSANGLSSVYQAVPEGATNKSITSVPEVAESCVLFWTRGQTVEAGFNSPRRNLRANPWNYTILPGDCPSEWVSSPTSADGVFHLHLRTALLDRLASETDTTSNVGLVAIGSDPIVEQLGRWLLRELQEDSPPAQLLWDSAATILGLQLLRGGHARTRQVGGLACWQARRTTEFLAEHSAEDVSLAALAEIAGLSIFHFARAFKQTTGLPPHAYLRRLRCERAKKLLIETSLSIGEIAAEVGYETPQAFARMFRAEVGASPSEYRREQRS